MATEEGLRIKLGATVDQLKSDINQAKAAISGLAQAVGQESSQVAAAGKNWNQLGKFIFDANYERRRMIQQINQGVGSWKLEATAVNNVAGNALPAFTRSSRSASTALTGLTRIAQDAPYGFLAIGNNISETILHMQNLSRQSGGLGSGLKALGSSIIGPGGIVLGLNLIITGITAAVQKYGSLGAAVDALLRPLSEQQKIQKSITDALQQGQKDAQSELVTLGKLYRAATDVNVPLAERNKIVDKLQKEYPAYFGNLSNEAILTGKAASQYNRLRDAIVAAATSRALDKKLEEQGSKRVDALFKEEEIRKKLSAAVSEQASAQNALDKLLSQTGAKSTGFITQQDQLTRKIANASAQVASLTNALKKNGQEFINIASAEDQLISIQDQITTKFGAMAVGVDEVKAKTTKGVKSISSILLELQKDITGLNVAFASTGGSIQDLAADKIKRLEKALKDLSEFGVRPGDKAFQQVDQQIKLLQNSLTKTPVTLKIPINIEPLPAAGFNHDAFRKTVADFFPTSDFQKRLQEFNEYAKSSLQDFKVNMISGIAEGIAAIATGSSSFGSVLGNLLSIVGDFAIGLGRAAIPIGIVAKAIKEAFKTPQGAIIAGAGLIVLGGLIKGYATKISSGPKLAVGGITNGPTMAMIGDNPSGKEVVAPLERLQSMLGGGYNGNVRFEIEGTKLVGILDRYDKLNNRG